MLYRTVLLLVSPILLAGCGTSNHETRSLLCFGFCSEQRVEHQNYPPEPTQPKEKKDVPSS